MRRGGGGGGLWNVCVYGWMDEGRARKGVSGERTIHRPNEEGDGTYLVYKLLFIYAFFLPTSLVVVQLV